MCLSAVAFKKTTSSIVIKCFILHKLFPKNVNVITKINIYLPSKLLNLVQNWKMTLHCNPATHAQSVWIQYYFSVQVAPVAAHQQAVAALSAAQTAAAAHQQQAVAQNLLFGDYASNLNTVLGQPGSAGGTHNTWLKRIAILKLLFFFAWTLTLILPLSLRCSRQCLQAVNNVGDPTHWHPSATNEKVSHRKRTPNFCDLTMFLSGGK